MRRRAANAFLWRTSLFTNLLLFPALAFLRLIRWLINADPRTYMGLHFGWIQPGLETVGRWKAHAVFKKASKQCPAYKQFLADPSVAVTRWSDIPVTTKENYVKKYSIEQRCYGGQIPSRGVVIDESSGSSGVPNNWVRGPEERSDVRKILQLSYDLLYQDQKLFAELLRPRSLGHRHERVHVSGGCGNLKVYRTGSIQTRKHA